MHAPQNGAAKTGTHQELQPGLTLHCLSFPCGQPCLCCSPCPLHCTSLGSIGGEPWLRCVKTYVSFNLINI